MAPAGTENRQQRDASSRQTRRMRKFYKLGALLLLLLILTVTGVTQRVATQLELYVSFARLSLKDPPSHIAMPVMGIKKQQVANTWHARRGADRLHEGQDIFAPRGTPIYSAAEGYVYRVGENRLGGQTVSVIGSGGRVYYYAHLDSFAPGLSAGDFVTPESVLGYVGTTGNAQGTPPHLHFGVYTASGAINPLPLLTDRKIESESRDQIDRVSAVSAPRSRSSRSRFAAHHNFHLATRSL